MITVIAEAFHVDDEALAGKATKASVAQMARPGTRGSGRLFVITAGHDVPEALFTGRD
jgi:hypothetical protein